MSANSEGLAISNAAVLELMAVVGVVVTHHFQQHTDIGYKTHLLV